MGIFNEKKNREARGQNHNLTTFLKDTTLGDLFYGTLTAAFLICIVFAIIFIIDLLF